MSLEREEMLKIYSRVVSGVEDILRGIPEKLSELSEADYANYGEHTQWVYRHFWVENGKEHGVELLFSNMEIARKRVREAIEYIKQQDVDFATLELICYASFYLIY